MVQMTIIAILVIYPENMPPTIWKFVFIPKLFLTTLFVNTKPCKQTENPYVGY